jgi:hypothetical protein
LHHWPGQSPSEYSHDSPGHLQPWDQLAWPRYSKLLPLHNDPDMHVRMLVVCTSCAPPHALHKETHLWGERELHKGVKPSPSSWRAVTSCHDSLLTSSAPNGWGVD